MNGAESLVRTLASAGVELCLSNPGTSEMHFVAALDGVPEIRPVLCLFEGVATGAADGYGRMANKPAATLLHLGPGLGNGIANLHNARRAATPIVNIVGDHATYHSHLDAPLASDIPSLARPVSGWVHTCTSARETAAAGAQAVAASLAPPGAIATLILPADTAWQEAEGPAQPLPIPTPAPADKKAVEAAAGVLQKTGGKDVALLLRGDALLAEGLEYAGRIAAASGARLLCDTFTPRLQGGAGRVPVERIPYFAEQAVEFLTGLRHIILVGAKPPVAFFAYPDKPGWLAPDDARFTTLSAPHQSGTAALRTLCEAIKAPPEPHRRCEKSLLSLAEGPLTPDACGQAIAHFLPDHAIISDEAATCGLAVHQQLIHAAPYDILSLTGGAIGQGLPVATGAALACPERKVVCLHGDGGAMYTVQSLWTQARENLDVTSVIFSNRSYAILNIELARVGADNPGPRALSMLDLHDPDRNGVNLAEAMGVSAVQATEAHAFSDAFAHAMKTPGPHRIEAVI